MPTQQQSVTSTAWVNIKSTLSLSDGVEYAIQNTGGESVYLTELSTAPAVTEEGHVIPTRQTWTFTPETNMNLYVRAAKGQTIITITEA